jgi:sugar lactone lactonase YvrE
VKKLILVSILLSIITFVSFHEANAVTITATPKSPSFGPNDWIIINLNVQGYNGGTVTWVAHRPDGSTISGAINQLHGGLSAAHEIIRDASDNYFGTWSIDYMYGGVKKTISFKVNPISLTVGLDKDIYYEPDIMKINITTSYYVPVAAHAQLYHLTFYDNNDNLLKNVYPIDIRALQQSIVYNFAVGQIAHYYPPGLYEMKVQYFNKIVQVPIALGEYRTLMEISAQTDKSSYKVGEDVNFNLLFTRVKESDGILKLTDPSGNTTTHPFNVDSVNTFLILKDSTKTIGTYQYEIQYATISKKGSFKVVVNPIQLPKITLEIFLDKLNYKPGENIHAKVSVSDIISDSITVWATDPNGTTNQKLSFPMSTINVILPHKISNVSTLGQWLFYVDYGGIVQSVPFYVKGSTVDENEMVNINQFSVPSFVSNFGSSEFSRPTGITVDSKGDFYVADSGNSKIEKFDPSGKLLRSWGSSGSGNGQFVHPNGIVVDKKYVYVADTGNARIQIFDKDGNFVYAWGGYGVERGMFHTPVSLAFDQGGDLFVADSGRDTVQVFDSHYGFISEIKPLLTEGGNFSATNGIVFDSQNNFYASAVDDKILKFSDVGNFVNFYGSSGTDEGRFNNPTAIAVDSKGAFYVADTNNNRIQKFDKNGNFLLTWGSKGSADGQFEEPVGLAIDYSDNIYVVDKDNNRIQKFALYGPTKVIAPSWTKDSAVLWLQGSLDKNEFAKVIRYLVNQGTVQNMQTNHLSVKIPVWVKTAVVLWESGQIDDNTFVHALQYLVSAGILKV